MYRFESDYLEGCLPEILKKLQDTNFEQTSGYGRDPHCERARSLIRIACEAPDADVHFLVGGTQTNATVISHILKPFQGVLSTDTGHINVHETGAIEKGGHKVLAIPGKDGKMDAHSLECVIESHFADPGKEHTVQPGIVYLSFPTELGTLYTLKELTQISRVCTKWGIPLFIDGARLGYGLVSPSSDVTLPDIARLADVFYIGGTKQGALFGEAVVFRDKKMSDNFRYTIKQNGGMLAKGRLIGLQFEVLLENGLYFKAARHAVSQAILLKEAFRNKGFDFLTDSSTNQQFPILPNEAIEQLSTDFSFDIWRPVDAGHTAVRVCTSWATTDDAISELVRKVQGL